MQSNIPVAKTHPVRQYLSHPVVRIMIPLLILSISFYVLYRLSQDINLTDVESDARAYGVTVLAQSFVVMCIGYVSLSLYEVIILRRLTDVNLPKSVLINTGFPNVAVSNMLGFSWLTGGAIRYRIYASFGVDITAVAKLVATSWIAFILGFLLLTGGLMMLHPFGLSTAIWLPNKIENLFGASILALIAGYFIWTVHPRSIGFGGMRMDLPLTGDGLKLVAVSIIDLIVTATVLYVLVPNDLAQNFALFFMIFVGAVVLGIISHSPSGFGVFEVAIIVGLGAVGRSDILAALAIYRLIYTIVPFFIVVIGLAFVWVLANRQRATDTSRIIFRVVGPLVPFLTAGLAMVSGAVLLMSGNLPSDPTRLGFLREVLPLALVETSHLIGSVIGVLLMIVSRGLYRRMFRAWLITMVLLGVGLMASLTKGIDWEAAITLGGAMVILWAFRAGFYRADIKAAFTLNWKWILSVLLLVGAISWIGFFAFSNVQYSEALWWQFAWKGDASRFLRATLAVAVLLAAVMLNTLLSKQTTRLLHEAIPDAVRKLTAESSAAEAGIALSGDKRFLISPDERAFLAYADTGSTLVSKGDPVGAKDAGIEMIWQLRELADKMGRRSAFYGVSERYLPTYLDLGLQVLKIGEVARVDLSTFSLEGPRRKDWRYAKGKAKRDGYVFQVIRAGDLAKDMTNLKAVSDAWLALKKSGEKGFSLGWFHPDYIACFDHAVLRHVQTGKIIAFANLMQTGDKSELSLDLMRYDPAGPALAMDALFAEMLIWGKQQGYAVFSLGAAPLSGLESRRLAPAWHQIGSFLYEHGEQFYHFGGLRSFKQKFDPNWAPEYLASSGRLDAARVLYEVSLLVSRGVKGMAKHDSNKT